ncbi:MAG: hypothetical protein HY327_13205 [Chloroflexi bacterium]|nr:hypothetical protein [Chloroflexota bacterium]
MEDLSSARPLAGRWIALDLRPARPLTLLGPAWAVLCGALASGGVGARGSSILFLLLALFLSDALLGAWRALWLESDWRATVRQLSVSAATWLALSTDAPHSRVARARERTARSFAYARQMVWPLVNSEIIGQLLIGLFALCLAILLGQAAIALTSGAMLLALIEGEIGAPRGAGMRAVYEISFPWLIGQSAFGFFSALSLFLLILSTITYRALLGLASTRQGHWLIWSNLAQFVVVLTLVAASAPIPAAVVALGLLAQILWQARYHLDRDGVAYARRAQSYVMISMLMAALAVWF